ncbi:ABC transporter permease, partial [Fulvivirga lutimaris]|uniref:ABC transporter permease n=1 Tax=Fulvivirga lutimaris TaxID=1819566 RepID=UPI0012BCF165
FFIVIGVIFISVTILSGLYPSVVTSGLQPIKALKNSIGSSYKNGLSLRSSLVVVQLLISQMLIVAVIVVSQQVDHFISQPIGVDTEAIVEFSIPYVPNMNRSSLKQQLLDVPGVKEVTYSNTGTTSGNTWGGVAHYTGGDELLDKDVQIKLIDDSYLDTYGVELLAGQNIKMDSIKRYLINEEAMAVLGFETYEEALGQEIAVWGKPGNIIGVVKNFKTMSLHYAQQPVVLWNADNSYLTGVKLENNSANWSETMAAVQSVWETHFPENIFSYNFLDDSIAKYYDSERRASKTFSLFASIAIIIGGIGLLGLMSYMVNTRTKEIGVRKVLGASVRQILATVFTDFAKLVVIAFAIAAPLSWYFMDKWLQGFDSRIDITFLTFILAFALSLLMTVIATGYKSFQGATLNPVDALSDE